MDLDEFWPDYERERTRNQCFPGNESEGGVKGTSVGLSFMVGFRAMIQFLTVANLKTFRFSATVVAGCHRCISSLKTSST